MIHRKRILFIFGTRPEAVKMAPVIKELEKHPDMLAPVVVVTGQHREMLDQVLGLFEIKPDYDLKIMEEEQTISHVVSRTLLGLEKIINVEKPDLILVQGDTSTTFAASLTSYYHRIPLGHIEAGLRTRDKYRPFPEEMNRKMTSAIADLHFAPTRSSMNNLIAEGIKRSSVYITGNTVIDALLATIKKDNDPKKLKIDVNDKKIILVTTHRRESFGAPLRSICEALKEIAKVHCEVATVVLPVHRNPMVSETIKRTLSGINNVRLIEPLDYGSFVHLMKDSYIILTDSGGIQEEAPSFGVPVLVLRDVTERPEAVEAGAVKVIGTDKNIIIKEIDKLLNDQEAYDKMARSVNPYGDGRASERIVSILLHYFGFTDVMQEEFSVDDLKHEKVI